MNSFIPFALHLLACLQYSNCDTKQAGRSHGGFNGMFVFGTSVVDSGNNVYLTGSRVRVDYTPYGIDFFLGPTGRYANADNIADVLGRLLGLPLIPAFLDPTTKGIRIIHGVNYGFGGSGILDTTGTNLFGRVISMSEQIDEFENTTLPELETLLNSTRAEILPSYLFVVATGDNDIAGYFLSANNITIEAYVETLISNFSNQLVRLYNLGARRFVLPSVYPLGCNPWIVEYTNSSGCFAALNRASEEFYTQLLSLTHQLTSTLPKAEFVVVNTYKIIINIINNPLLRGFENARDGCCERMLTGEFKIACKEGGKVCSNRSTYVYFDGQHTTTAVNAIVATKAFSSVDKTDVYPFNVMQLAMI